MSIPVSPFRGAEVDTLEDAAAELPDKLIGTRPAMAAVRELTQTVDGLTRAFVQIDAHVGGVDRLGLEVDGEVYVFTYTTRWKLRGPYPDRDAELYLNERGFVEIPVKPADGGGSSGDDPGGSTGEEPAPDE